MKRSLLMFVVFILSIYMLIGCGGGSHDSIPLSTSNNTINYILECDKTSLDHTKDQTIESKNTKIFLPNYSMKKDFNISIKRIDTQNLSSDNLYSLLNNLGLDANSQLLSPVLIVTPSYSSSSSLRAVLSLENDGFSLKKMSQMTINLNNIINDWDNYIYYLAFKSFENSKWSYTPFTQKDYDFTNSIIFNQINISSYYVVLCLPKQNNTDTSTNTNTNTNTSTNTSTNTNSSTNTNTSTYTSTSTNTDTSIDTEGKITSIVLTVKPSILIASATNNCFETNVELNVCIKYEGNDIFKYNLPTIEFSSINSFDLGNSIKSKLIDSTNKYTYSGFVAPQNTANGQATFTLVLPTKGITYDPYKHPENIFITSCLLNSKQERMVSEPIILSFKAIDNNENQNRTTIATLTSPDLSLPISTDPIFYISFSNSMNEYSKNAVSISKVSDNKEVYILTYWVKDSENKELIFGPDGNKLEPTTLYQIKINENNAIDWKGNPIVKFTPLTFRTQNEKATIAFADSNVFMLNRVCLNPTITVDFKKKVYSTDSCRNAIKIITNNKEVNYNLQWRDNNSKAIITFDNNKLIASTTYTICLKESVYDENNFLIPSFDDYSFNTVTCSNGNGLPEDPFLIYTASDLDNVRYTYDACYKVMNDINLATSTYISATNDKNYGWKPIELFYGSFDGNNKTISGLSINRPQENELGLFRLVDKCDIRNVILATNTVIIGREVVGSLIGTAYSYGYDIKINNYKKSLLYNCKNFGSVNGYLWVGGLVACTVGTDSQVLNNDIIVNCSNYGNVIGDTQGIGGIVGRNEVRISNCKNYGKVVTNDNYFDIGGGITGVNYSYITNCINYGEITRGNGITGRRLDFIPLSPRSIVSNCKNYGIITNGCGIGGDLAENCINYGNINGSGIGAKLCKYCINIGKITGGGGINYYCNNVEGYEGIENCINLGEIIGNKNVGGIVAILGNKAYVKNCYVDCSITAESDYGAIIGTIEGDNTEPVSVPSYITNNFVTSSTTINSERINSEDKLFGSKSGSYEINFNYILNKGTKSEINNKTWSEDSSWNNTQIWHLDNSNSPSLVNCVLE